MNNAYAIAALGALVVLLLAASLVRYVRLYALAKVAGAPVSMPELLGMKLRRLDPAAIVFSRIMAVREGIALSTADLEALALAGGDVARVVNAMVIARRSNVELTWHRATAIELAGWDVLAAARGTPDPRMSV